MGNGCIVHKDVDAAEFGFNVCDHALDIRGDRHIGLHRDCRASQAHDFATHAICSVGSLTVIHGDIRASPSQRDGDCGSDSSTAASHKSNSIPEVFHGVIVCVGLRIGQD
jgi:hypothetical protein